MKVEVICMERSGIRQTCLQSSRAFLVVCRSLSMITLGGCVAGGGIWINRFAGFGLRGLDFHQSLLKKLQVFRVEELDGFDEIRFHGRCCGASLGVQDLLTPSFELCQLLPHRELSILLGHCIECFPVRPVDIGVQHDLEFSALLGAATAVSALVTGAPRDERDQRDEGCQIKVLSKFHGREFKWLAGENESLGARRAKSSRPEDQVV